MKMQKRIRWGVLGAADIAVRKVIPGMLGSELCEVSGIASRDAGKARAAAESLGIAKAYGSYEELLNDPEIDAVYNPLPNHLHLPWSTRAAQAGKHVLCEKPIALSVAETHEMIAARDRSGVKIGEAFMVRTHPLWLRAREIVRSGQIGELRAITSTFSYFNRNPENIRNVASMGGGGVMDIGCYPITMSRFLFGREPGRVVGLVERDPYFGTDRLTSALLDFAPGQATFTCSTQLVPYQEMQILGTKGRVGIEIPYNIPADRPARLVLDDGRELGGLSELIEELPAVNQYGLQGDAFSRAILEDTAVPVPLEDSLRNMAVIEAVLRSGATGLWEKPTV
jgi:predicted dehydrogenase